MTMVLVKIESVFASLNTMFQEMKKTVIRFHAVTGNNYTSTFFRKGKQKCWKVMLTRESFVTAFKNAGSHWDLSDKLIVEAL